MTQKRKRCDNRFEIAAARAIRSGEMRAIDLARELGIDNSFFARAETDHIAECVLRASTNNTPTTAIRLLGHYYQVFSQGRKKERSACQERSAYRRRIISHAPAEPLQ